MLPQEGFRLETIEVKGLKGRGVRGLLDAVYGIPAGLVQSSAIIKKFRPDCVIGLGGYASGPVLLAAKLRGMRCAIMEQNLQPGFTNKMLARLVDRVFTSYRRNCRLFLPARRCWRPGIQCVGRGFPDAPKDEKFTLLVFGGSAGAHRINMAVVDALEQMTDLASQLRIVHQTGAIGFFRNQQSLSSSAVRRRGAAVHRQNGRGLCARRSRALPSRRYNGGGAHGVRQSRRF